MNNRPLVIALAVSLTLNVFILGAVAGAFGSRARMYPHRAPPAVGNPLMRLGERLPEDQRRPFRDRIAAQALANRPLAREARQARTRAAELFARPTFDKAAINAELARARALDETARERLEGAVVDFAAELPVEQRKVLGDGLRRPARPGRRPHTDGPQRADLSGSPPP